jgi:hypothetical protein
LLSKIKQPPLIFVEPTTLVETIGIARNQKIKDQEPEMTPLGLIKPLYNEPLKNYNNSGLMQPASNAVKRGT